MSSTQMSLLPLNMINVSPLQHVWRDLSLRISAPELTFPVSSIATGILYWWQYTMGQFGQYRQRALLGFWYRARGTSIGVVLEPWQP